MRVNFRPSDEGVIRLGIILTQPCRMTSFGQTSIGICDLTPLVS